MAQTIDSMGTYLAHGASGIIEHDEGIVTKRPYSNNASSLEELGLRHAYSSISVRIPE
jgi:hypothetical protein